MQKNEKFLLTLLQLVFHIFPRNGTSKYYEERKQNEQNLMVISNCAHLDSSFQADF